VETRAEATTAKPAEPVAATKPVTSGAEMPAAAKASAAPASPAPASPPADEPPASDAEVAAAGKSAPVSDEFKPVLLTAPEGGKGDDLELIWGVGPKLAAMLNKMGVWHFRQIAAWTDMNLRWVDQNLGTFKGRAVRDKWIEQAVKLASGWRPENDIGDKPKG
jgi:NADH-quinone oxidoreductase subunit E